MHPPAHKRSSADCASLRVRRSLTPLQVLTLLVGFRQEQSVLVNRNPFFVVVLGFDVVDSVENEGFFKIVCTGMTSNRHKRLLAAKIFEYVFCSTSIKQAKLH